MQLKINKSTKLATEMAEQKIKQKDKHSCKIKSDLTILE